MHSHGHCWKGERRPWASSLELAVEGLEHLTLLVDVLVRPPREGHGLARTGLIGNQAFHRCVYLSEVLL